MFLENYKTYVSNSEANDSYHLWSALVALSTVVSRKVWIEQGMFKVYPNLYVVLVGPPGNRKTTAMSVAKKLIRETVGAKFFSAEATTRESLIRAMAANQMTYVLSEQQAPVVYTPLTVCVTEFSEFLGAGGAGMVNFLTTIYDQDYYDYKTKNKGNDEIINPYFVMLGCTTPAWITARLKDDVISGGFSRRAIFVYEYERAKRIAFPLIHDFQLKAWEDLLEYTKRVSQVVGEFSWADGAKEFYEDWYVKLEIPDDPNISGYFESKHIQLLKVSMLLSLSESLDRVLTVRHLECGLALLASVETNLAKVFEGMGRNELNSVATKIMDVMRKMQRVPYRRLERIFFRECSADEFYKITLHLFQTQQLVKLTTSNGGDSLICLPEAVPAQATLQTQSGVAVLPQTSAAKLTASVQQQPETVQPPELPPEG